MIPRWWPTRSRWHLADADARHHEFPDTFDIPSAEAKAALRGGDIVKLIFVPRRGHVERMWTVIDHVDGDRLVGHLDNDPYGIRGLEAGAQVVFERRHVCAIVEH